MDDEPEFTKRDIVVRQVMLTFLAAAGLVGGLFSAFLVPKAHFGMFSASAFVCAASIFCALSAVRGLTLIECPPPVKAAL